jgi:Zinc binding domain
VRIVQGFQGPRPCPVTARVSQPVPWRTVAALAAGAVPSHQAFWICPDPGCDVVYFGEDGARLSVSELRFAPGFKSTERDPLLCYCFLHRHGEVEEEVRQQGGSDLAERIARRVEAGDCLCAVRNPTGRCCLPEVKRAVAALAGEATSRRDRQRRVEEGSKDAREQEPPGRGAAEDHLVE